MGNCNAEISPTKLKQTFTKTPVLRRLGRSLCLLCALTLLPATSGFSQGSIVNALLKLRSLRNNVSVINGRLYGGFIDSQITHSGNRNEVTASDTMFMHVADPKRRLEPVNCGFQQAQVTKAIFDDCVVRNVDRIVQILFPASLSSSVAAADAAQNHSELFLLTTALGVAAPSRETTRRNDIGGLIELERFSGDGRSGHALQGLYQFQSLPVSIHARYARGNDSVSTDSSTITADFHPGFQMMSELDWRIGLDGHSGLVYSRSSALGGNTGFDPLRLGSFDFGGGGWTSVQRDFSRVRVGGATLFQASKSKVPSLAGNEFEFVTEAMNKRPVSFDLAYGGLVGFLTSDNTSLNGKFIETRSVASDVNKTNWPRPPARLAMVSLSYLIGGITPIDFGYKISTGSGVTAHSIFVLGNFHW